MGHPPAAASSGGNVISITTAVREAGGATSAIEGEVGVDVGVAELEENAA